ncbi:MAG: hypothetical protein JJE04_16805 [Acidobacteriia bacterium]|nr:hypothetical protein [Terriglobia bacterium]
MIRLYPVSLRYLENNQQYKLWTWVSFEAKKSEEDKRKESYRVREESIKVLSEVESKAEQFSLIKKAISEHREALEVAYRDQWTSLGIIPVELTSVSVKENDAIHLQQQQRLDVDVLPLDGFPADVRVKYRCRNNPECKGHGSSIIAWEYAQAFRTFKAKYGIAEAPQRVKSALEARHNSADRDVYALIGTHSRYPVWMIGQLYAFEKNLPEMLF